MDQCNTVWENGETRRTKVGHARTFSISLCTNHAIGTSGGKNERIGNQKHPKPGEATPANRPAITE
jgi:hypothetical protein